jgi:hypothetical protein
MCTLVVLHVPPVVTKIHLSSQPCLPHLSFSGNEQVSSSKGVTKSSIFSLLNEYTYIQKWQID